MISEIFNMDCMEGMKQYSDNHFDLAIVDPPYGINVTKMDIGIHRNKKKDKYKNWDNSIPDKSYFNELFRVSKNQIIWGGNYFPYLWKLRCRGFIFWYKQSPVKTFSDGELAWTSFNKPAKCFNFRSYGNLQGNTVAPKKIHLTQKPVQLYEWLLMNYAKHGDKILDTHLGSGSSRIAAHNLVFDFTGYEINKEYLGNAEKRFITETAQKRLF